MSARSHHHDHGHGGAVATTPTSRAAQRRALWWSLGANAGFMVVEVVGGVAFASLALLADAAHMLSDVAGLAIALVAQQLASRRATTRHTYGLQRAEVLGAQVNGLLLLVMSGWIMFEAVSRIGSPADVQGGGVLVVATLGLLVNLGSAFLLARVKGSSLNLRGAYLHMVLDAAGSLAAMVAAIAVIGWDAAWVDPVASIGISLLVVWSAWGLLRDTAHVLLEGTPRGMDPVDVEQALLDDVAVEAVHHLHLWNLASDVPALSAHVVLEGEDVTLHDAQASGDRLKALLDERFGIEHATLELECHPCAPEPTHDASAAGPA